MAGHALPLMYVTILDAMLVRRGTNIFNSSHDLYYEAAGWCSLRPVCVAGVGSHIYARAFPPLTCAPFRVCYQKS